MRSLTTIVLVLALCSGFARAEGKRALVVGIDDYLTEEARLAGAVNDARGVASLLGARFGFRDEDVVLLLDRDATRERILAEMRRLFLERSAPGDLAVMYYAGHGSFVKNTLAKREQDMLDETIVPYPAPSRTDIRDKEIGKILEEAARKGVRVTTIFDSCHSGSISRGPSRPGRVRKIAPDPAVEVADPSEPDPRAAGALTFAAAQEFQGALEASDDQGQPHGAFTLALLQALREAPRGEPAADLFLRVRAILHRNGSVQEPAVDAEAKRLREPLFRQGDQGSQPLAVALLGVDGAEVELQGGTAIGIAPGAVLTRRKSEGLPALVVKVVKADLVRSRAQVVEGDAKGAKAGQLFDVTKWAAPASASLRVHVPPARPRAEVMAALGRLEPLRNLAAVHWVADPSELSPTHLLVATARGWTLVFPDGREMDLGASPKASDVERALAGAKGVAGRAPPCAEKPCLYVRCPPAEELLAGLTVGREPDDAIRRVGDGESHYVLAGRVEAGRLQYAWLLSAPPARRGDGAPPALALPRRSTWVDFPSGTESQAAARTLDDLVFRIARVRDWLTLGEPPDAGDFPYRLVLRNRDGGQELGPGGAVRSGEAYNLFLRADRERLRQGGLERRFLYVIGIDSTGAIKVLYPRQAVGASEIRFPVVGAGEDWPEVQQIGGRNVGFKVVAPFGRDTYILVTSREAIPNLSDVEQDAVLRGRPLASEGDTALSRLLRSRGATKRGVGELEPTGVDWAIQRVEVESRQ